MVTVELKPDRDAIAVALDEYLDAPGLLGITLIYRDGNPRPKSQSFETTSEGLEQAADWIVRHDSDDVVGIYHRGTTLATEVGAKERGDAENTRAWPSYRLDLDYGKEGFAPDLDTVLKIAATADLPEPSEWIHSGHGAYPVWHLTNAISDGTPVRELAEAIHAEMARAFAEHGYKIDKCSDAARIWRIPGTVNRKDERNPVMARQLSNGGPLHPWGDLQAEVPTPAEPLGESTESTTADQGGKVRPFTDHQAREFVSKNCWDKIAALAPTPGRAAPVGNRNTTVNEAAMALGHFVPAFCTWDAAFASVVAECEAIGYTDKDRNPTIKSGLTAGMEDRPNAKGERFGTVVRVEEPSITSPPVDGEDVAAAELAERVRKIRLEREARRLADADEHPPPAPPTSTSLRDLLAEEPSAVKYRIEDMWPTNGKILITAPKKSGKTTLIGNLVRCLADGSPFLVSNTFAGHQGFEVAPLDDRKVMVLDFEMTRDMLRTWLADQRIQNLDAIEIELMRGRTWDPRDHQQRKQWAAYLRSMNVGTLLVDPIGPVLHGLGIEENSNSEVGALLTALDRLCHEADVDELAVVHHAGHGAEQRSRGASVFLGWPDATWELKRETDGSTLRFLSAEGRDVLLPETALTYDWATRRLALGTGGRTEARSAGDAEIIAAIVAESPGKSVNELKKLARETEIGTKAQRQQDAIRAAKDSGLIHVHHGANRAQHHHPGRACDQCGQGS